METVQLQGRVNLARFIDALAIGDPAECTGRLSWMLDFSQADLDLTSGEVVQLALAVAEYRKTTQCSDQPCKVALLVDGDANYGIGRMIQAYASIGDVNVLVTRCANDANAFLAA